ncbi:MAG: RDD family protein [Candidatus Bathyarchaeia archaeon]
MAVEQESISKILSILSHPLRREILLSLSEKGESSFTELLNLLKVDTGKLSFHLRALEAFIEQTPSGKYRLTRAGENAVRIVHDIEGWAEVADIQRKESQLPLASLRKRTGGFLIDFAIILAITTAIIFLPSALSMNLKSLLSGGLSTVIFITVGLLWLYSTLLEGFNGQSIGKRITGLKVVRVDGKKMNYDYAAIRNFGKILPILPFDLFIGIWRIPDKKFMRYFDKFAGTTVIDLRWHPVQPTMEKSRTPVQEEAAAS